MAANGFITTAELNFDTYKSNLKQYLSSQAVFNDYNFEGSNFSVLLDILAYNTYLNAFYLNMVGSEMFLDTAQLPESVTSHAKELNYTPSSRSSSKSVVTLTVAAASTSGNASYITVPKNYKLSTTLDGKTYVFSTPQSYTIARTGSLGFVSSNVEIYEGKVTSEYFTEANTASTKTRYILSSSNVDISSVDVKIRSSVSTPATLLYPYNRSYDLYGLTPTTNNYFIQGYGQNKYEVVFGNGVSGRSLTPGNIVQITYRDSSGDVADNAKTFKAIDNLQNDLGQTIAANLVRVSTVLTSSSGSERESVDSIKFNAPRYYTTQNRAITTEDYTSLIKINFPAIEAVSVYGGETANPKQYGKVVIVLKPFGTDVASDLTKESIKNYLLTRMPLGITPVFTNPDSFYVSINTTVYYNPTITSKQSSDIRSAVISTISSFSSTNLQNFNENLRFSKLVTAIDAADTSIVSNDTIIQMIKRLTPTINTSYSTVVNFNNAIYPTTSITDASVNSSTFYIDVDGVTTAANIKDDGSGVLYLVTSNTKTSIGSVDYATGEIIITNLTVVSYTNYISLYAYTATQQDILTSGNQIFTIDTADVNINVETALN